MCVRRSRLLRVSLAHGFALALFGLVSGPPGVARAQVPTEVAVYEDGQTTRRVRAAEAGREGLTLLDLRDDWAPRPFAASDGHTDGPSYRAPFVALANGQLGSGPEAVRPLYDRHLELHGIPPALTLLRARLEDTERHRCRDAVDDTALQAMTGVQRPFEDVGRQRARRAENELLGARLERERVRTGAPTLEALAADARYTKPVRRYLAERIRFDAVRAVQAHLRCERTLDGPADGLYAGVTQYALGLFQREHMLPSKGLLDEDTRAALLADSRELDFRAVLRVLRERTADAAALIEDGSAAGATDDGAQSVLGRHLEVSRMRADASRGPLPNAAPDLIGPATEAAARALGLTSPEAATRALPALMTAGVVAVKLPPPPPWHTPPMSLRAEIDRGDVYTAWPYGPDGKRKTWDVERRPVLTLYARGGDGGPGARAHPLADDHRRLAARAPEERCHRPEIQGVARRPAGLAAARRGPGVAAAPDDPPAGARARATRRLGHRHRNDGPRVCLGLRARHAGQRTGTAATKRPARLRRPGCAGARLGQLCLHRARREPWMPPSVQPPRPAPRGLHPRPPRARAHGHAAGALRPAIPVSGHGVRACVHRARV
jgi:hypothetical protein